MTLLNKYCVYKPQTAPSLAVKVIKQELFGFFSLAEEDSGYKFWVRTKQLKELPDHRQLYTYLLAKGWQHESDEYYSYYSLAFYEFRVAFVQKVKTNQESVRINYPYSFSNLHYAQLILRALQWVSQQQGKDLDTLRLEVLATR